MDPKNNCDIFVGGDSNTQNIACNGGFCGNSRFNYQSDNFNSQNTACPQSGCLNNGEDTNVYANLASATCFSSGPDTTTICQKDRSFVFPNH